LSSIQNYTPGIPLLLPRTLFPPLPPAFLQPETHYAYPYLYLEIFPHLYLQLSFNQNDTPRLPLPLHETLSPPLLRLSSNQNYTPRLSLPLPGTLSPPLPPAFI
ncbi:hypothetical protein WA026_003633, partial [Henosepilachna vigintioctopunctata]